MLCDRIVHDPGRKAAYNRLNSCVEFDASTQLAPTWETGTVRRIHTCDAEPRHSVVDGRWCQHSKAVSAYVSIAGLCSHGIVAECLVLFTSL